MPCGPEAEPRLSVSPALSRRWGLRPPNGFLWGIEDAGRLTAPSQASILLLVAIRAHWQGIEARQGRGHPEPPQVVRPSSRRVLVLPLPPPRPTWRAGVWRENMGRQRTGITCWRLHSVLATAPSHSQEWRKRRGLDPACCGQGPMARKWEKLEKHWQ